MDEGRELERLRARLEFQARVDEFLESASIRRLSLDVAEPLVLHALDPDSVR